MEKKFKVLVAEDEVITANCLCDELPDYDVEALGPFTSGKMVVETALKEKPDLIIMDIRLPGEIDGIEAARQINEKINIPIIFMTSYATKDTKELAQSVGYIEYFEKPIIIEQFLPIIEQLKKDRLK